MPLKNTKKLKTHHTNQLKVVSDPETFWSISNGISTICTHMNILQTNQRTIISVCKVHK